MRPYTQDPVHTLASNVVSGNERTNSWSRRLCISCRVPKPPGNQESIHGRLVVEAVIRQDGQTGLRLHGTCGVGDQKGIELGIEPARNGKDAVGRREIDDLGVLEDVDAESESGECVVRDMALVRYASWPAVTNGKSMSVCAARLK